MEIKVIIGKDGEDYININDLNDMMQLTCRRAMFSSNSVFFFIKYIIKQLTIARRA